MPEGGGSNDCHLCHIHDHAPSSTLLRTHPLRSSQSRSRNPSKSSTNTLHRNHNHHHIHHHPDGGHHSRDNGTIRDSDSKQARVASALAKLSERSHSLPGSRSSTMSRPNEVSILPNGSAHDHVHRGGDAHSLTRSQREYNNVLSSLLDTRIASIPSTHSPSHHREPDLLNALPRTRNNSRASTLSRVQLHHGPGSNLTLAQDTEQDYYTHINRARYKDEARKQRFNIQTVMLIGCYTMLFVVAIIVGVVLCQQNGWLGFGHGSSSEISDNPSGSAKKKDNGPSSMRDLGRPTRGRDGRWPGPTIDYDYTDDGPPPRINTAGIFPGGPGRGTTQRKVPGLERDPLRTVNFQPTNPSDGTNGNRKRPPGQRIPSPVGDGIPRNRFGQADGPGVRGPGGDQGINTQNSIGSGKSITDSRDVSSNNGLNGSEGNIRNPNVNGGQSSRNNPLNNFAQPGRGGTGNSDGSRRPGLQNFSGNTNGETNQNFGVNSRPNSQNGNPSINSKRNFNAAGNINSNGARGSVNGASSGSVSEQGNNGNFGLSQGNQRNQPSGNFDSGSQGNFPSGSSSTNINSNAGSGSNGRGNFNAGSNLNGRGNLNQGSNSNGQGNFNQGSISNGHGNFNQGSSSTGQRNFNQGSRSNGQGNLNQGLSSTGQGNFNQGSSSTGQGNFNQGSGSVGLGNFNQGSSSNGQGNFNRGSGSNRQGSFNAGSGSSGRGNLDTGSGFGGNSNFNTGSRGVGNFDNGASSGGVGNSNTDPRGVGNFDSTDGSSGVQNFDAGSSTGVTGFDNLGGSSGVRNLNTGSGTQRSGNLQNTGGSGGVRSSDSGFSTSGTMNFDNLGGSTGVRNSNIGSGIGGTTNFDSTSGTTGVQNSNTGSGTQGMTAFNNPNGFSTQGKLEIGSSATGTNFGNLGEPGGVRNANNGSPSRGPSNFANTAGSHTAGHFHTGSRPQTIGNIGINSGSGTTGSINFNSGTGPSGSGFSTPGSGNFNSGTRIGSLDTSPASGTNNFNMGTSMQGHGGSDSNLASSGTLGNLGTGAGMRNLNSGSTGTRNFNSGSGNTGNQQTKSNMSGLGIIGNFQESNFGSTSTNRGNAQNSGMGSTGGGQTTGKILSNSNIPTGTFGAGRPPTAVTGMNPHGMRDLGNGDRRRMPGGRNLNLQGNLHRNQAPNTHVQQTGDDMKPATHGVGQNNNRNRQSHTDMVDALTAGLGTPALLPLNGQSAGHNWDKQNSPGGINRNSGLQAGNRGTVGVSSVNSAGANSQISSSGVGLPLAVNNAQSTGSRQLGNVFGTAAGPTLVVDDGSNKPTPPGLTSAETDIITIPPANDQVTPLKVMRGFSVQRGEVVAISTIKSSDKDVSILQPDHDVIFHITPNAPDAGVSLIRHPSQDPGQMGTGMGDMTGTRMTTRGRPAPVVRQWEHTDQEGTLSRGLVRKDGSFAFTNCRPSEICGQHSGSRGS